ncbi:MAG: FAD-dependent oxidoreductase, partial [Lentisphaeria bacterium]|nr:FAD-dependent oxidoreductase [Lentisphaeria bacterium]MBQ9503344.1 FAD-dependent oxidoreductase [Lentisphaeria bacterium]
MKEVCYDVVVCGGGVAGVAAAVAAARRGAKTALVEKQCLLGGLATSGLIYVFLPLCDGYGHQVTFGLAEEMIRRCT